MFTDKEKKTIALLHSPQRKMDEERPALAPELKKKIFEHMKLDCFTYEIRKGSTNSLILYYRGGIFLEYIDMARQQRQVNVYELCYQNQLQIMRQLLLVKSPLLPDNILVNIAYQHLMGNAFYKIDDKTHGHTLFTSKEKEALVIPRELHSKFEKDPNIVLITPAEDKKRKRDEHLAKEKLPASFDTSTETVNYEGLGWFVQGLARPDPPEA